MGVLELVDRFRLGRNGLKTVQVQVLSSIFLFILIYISGDPPPSPPAVLQAPRPAVLQGAGDGAGPIYI